MVGECAGACKRVKFREARRCSQRNARLQKHEETAMDKYEALIKKLKDDKRLEAMLN